MIAIDTTAGRLPPGGSGDHATFDAHRIGPVEPMMPRLGNLDGWMAAIRPGDVFRHPREVLGYPGLTEAEKRGILAAWASDTHAVDSCPGLRCLSGCRAEPVPVDAVLEALQLLDGPSRAALN